MAWVETERGVREQLRLYDTRGLHDSQDLPRHYYSVADGFVLVYSVDSLESFKKVDTLKKEIDKSRDKKEVWLSPSTIQPDSVIDATSVLACWLFHQAIAGRWKVEVLHLLYNSKISFPYP